MRGNVVLVFLVAVLALMGIYVVMAKAEVPADLADVRFDYVQLGLWLAVGNAIGVPVGQALLGFIQRAWTNLTHDT